MSKVVTIPKDRNPFVVIVNGVKHSYPAGVTTEVPDEVADVIEKYVGAKPKPDPNAGINFGGALIVTITRDGDTYSTDKTFAEISAAVEGGVMVQCVIKEPFVWTFFSFSQYVPSAAVTFTNIQGHLDAQTGGADMILHTTVVIGSDNAVFLQSISASA